MGTVAGEASYRWAGRELAEEPAGQGWAWSPGPFLRAELMGKHVCVLWHRVHISK